MNSIDTTARPEIPFAGLVAFEAAARLGSVSRAADELDLTQSAVSQRVLKLEAFVGQRLFVRESHGMRLTGAGELLLGTARETLERLHAGLLRIAPYRSKASLLLACPPAFASGWLMPRLPALRALHPGLEVWLMEERELRTIDRIDVDLIVSRRPRHDDDVEAALLLRDVRVAIAGPRTAARIGDAPWPRLAAKAPLLMLESEPEWAGLLQRRETRALGPERAATIQDERLLVEAVAQELGVALVARSHAAQALAAGRVVALAPVPAPEPPPLWLMRSRLTARTPLADVAFDWLLAQAAAEAASPPASPATRTPAPRRRGRA